MSGRNLTYEALLARLRALEQENAELRERLGMKIPTPSGIVDVAIFQSELREGRGKRHAAGEPRNRRGADRHGNKGRF